MATCPVCNEYEGEPQSVEAHISGSTDEEHLGEQGSNWRSTIRQVDEGNVEEPAGFGGTSGVSTSVDTGQVGPPIDDDERATVLGAETDVDEVESEGSGGERSSTTLGIGIVLASVLLVLVVAAVESGDATDDEEQEESDDEGSPTASGWS